MSRRRQPGWDLSMIKYALTCAALVLPMGPALAGPAGANTSPGCVSESEYVHVDKGTTKAKVTRIFGTAGVAASGGFARSYSRCDSTDGSVVIVYRHTKLSRKTWQSSAKGDVSVLQGNDRRNSIDLASRPVHPYHVYAGKGADYIVMQANGYPDVIRCGGGQDIVQYYDFREPQDTYNGCERVELYSP